MKCLQNCDIRLLTKCERRLLWVKRQSEKIISGILRPPLTFLDKSIYFLCIVFSFLGALLLAFCFDDIQNMIAFNKPGTVAYRSNASFLFALPFIIFLEISALALFISGWESKKPIFGSKKYKYGEYPFREDCFPLFSSQETKST